MIKIKSDTNRCISFCRNGSIYKQNFSDFLSDSRIPIYIYSVRLHWDCNNGKLIARNCFNHHRRLRRIKDLFADYASFHWNRVNSSIFVDLFTLLIVCTSLLFNYICYAIWFFCFCSIVRSAKILCMHSVCLYCIQFPNIPLALDSHHMETLCNWETT